jgi:hypothetical protein
VSATEAHIDVVAESRQRRTLGCDAQTYRRTQRWRHAGIFIARLPQQSYCSSLAYSAAFHQHQDEKAAQALEVCLQYASYAAPIMRQALMTDAAVFQARRRKNIELAQQWLAALPSTTEVPWLRLRAEGAILEAQGDLQGSLRKLDDAEKLILAAPNQAQREISLRFLRRWQSELQPQLGMPV